MLRLVNPVLGGLVLMALWQLHGQLSAAEPEDPASRVTVAPVISREITMRRSFVGTVEPLRTSVVGSAVDGRVLEFLVNEGDAVKAKQPLAKVRTSMLEIQLAAAQAELQLRKEELAELENGSLPEEIIQAEARLRGTKAAFDYRVSNSERALSLFKQNRTVTDEQLREAQSETEQAEQMYLEAKAAHALVVQGPRKEKIAQARAQVLMQSEQVNLIKEQILRHTVVAPFDGYITAEHTEVGEWIGEGDPVVEVVQLNEVDVRAGVLSEQAAHLRVGSEVPVQFAALPGQTLTGHVALIIPSADELSRAIPVKVRLKNPIVNGGPILKAGMMAHVLLPTTHTQAVLMVPKDSLVLAKDERPVVYVLEKDTKRSGQLVVKPVAVAMGVSDGEWIEVKGQLRADQQVVVKGNERLSPGDHVEVIDTIEPKSSAK